MSKFCLQCGAALNAGARFCGECGAPVSAASPKAKAASHPPAKKSNWLLIGGVAGAIALVIAYYFIFLHDDASSGLEDRVADQPVEAEAAVAKVYYAMLEANIRDKASTQGSTVLGKLPRGESASGKVILGEDGTSDWLELADGKGFVALVNLSEIQPPELSKMLDDKKWTANEALDVWAQPDPASTLMERVAAGTSITLVGLTANDYVEVKLPKGGVGYIAGGERIAKLASGKPIAIAFNANTCSFGPELDAMFATIGNRVRANYKALENKEYPSEEARSKALASIEGRSTFQKLERNFEGLTVTAIAQHYESQSVYFAEPASRVIEVFRSKGLRIGRDGSIPSSDLFAAIGSAAGEGGRYGKSDLSCGV